MTAKLNKTIYSRRLIFTILFLSMLMFISAKYDKSSYSYPWGLHHISSSNNDNLFLLIYSNYDLKNNHGKALLTKVEQNGQSTILSQVDIPSFATDATAIGDNLIAIPTRENNELVIINLLGQNTIKKISSIKLKHSDPHSIIYLQENNEEYLLISYLHKNFIELFHVDKNADGNIDLILLKQINFAAQYSNNSDHKNKITSIKKANIKNQQMIVVAMEGYFTSGFTNKKSLELLLAPTGEVVNNKELSFAKIPLATDEISKQNSNSTSSNSASNAVNTKVAIAVNGKIKTDDSTEEKIALGRLHHKEYIAQGISDFTVIKDAFFVLTKPGAIVKIKEAKITQIATTVCSEAQHIEHIKDETKSYLALSCYKDNIVALYDADNLELISTNNNLGLGALRTKSFNNDGIYLLASYFTSSNIAMLKITDGTLHPIAKDILQNY